MTLHPNFPVVEGTIQMTVDWSVVLPTPYNRRMEDGSLVFWKPGMTMWIAVWNNDADESPDECLAGIQRVLSPDRTNEITESEEGIIRYAYRLEEEADDNREAAFHTFAIGRNGHVQMAVYFDAETHLPEAMAIWRSLSESSESGQSI